jgi:hypothetical protein
VPALSREVQEAFRLLPTRYLGAEAGFDATYHVCLADVGHTWEIRCTRTARGFGWARPGAAPTSPSGTDAKTWLQLREGELSGIEAFSQRRLYARGEIDLALGFEGLFRLPNGRPPLLRIHDVPVGRLKVSTLTMGEGPTTWLRLHGLGGAKSSFFDTAAALSPRYRVHAMDLPGFGVPPSRTAGSLQRGVLRPHGGSAPWTPWDPAGSHRRQLDGRARRPRARPPQAPDGSAASPAVPRRGLRAPRVASARARVATRVRPAPALAGPRAHREQFWSLFADRDHVDPSVGDIAVDEFERIYRTAGARLAFLTSARNIYLEKPYGRGGFYPRLAHLAAPAMFVWSSHDKLIPPGFQRHVERWLPTAEHIRLEGCGHVPQVERPTARTACWSASSHASTPSGPAGEGSRRPDGTPPHDRHPAAGRLDQRPRRCASRPALRLR